MIEISLHHFFLDIPANTSNYIEDSAKVEIGEISKVEVYWPLNVNRLASVWFVDGETQIIPAGGYLTGNGNVQNFEQFEALKSGRLAMRGINLDTVYSHAIDAWVNIIPDGAKGGVLSGF